VRSRATLGTDLCAAAFLTMRTSCVFLDARGRGPPTPTRPWMYALAVGAWIRNGAQAASWARRIATS
jgi:hypothetical protein